ncbi:putative entry exclusion protein TrbK-alt [Brucella anthropi]|uniref:putative entry exclusion protein TrbK-alt n=1 Tax=Brucella anthropi TaxID=529 RepID=UPI00244BAC9D|nr:putative entry exclusion protein TrbK-alt [Brucella anthropi]MDH0370082.1 putative entry exclusion protein TrbK-alt [Brucella anthropi]
MDGKMLARLGAVVFIAIAVTATAIDMARKDEPSAPPPAFQPPADPLRETLRRCQQLGEAAASDGGCLAAWAESRDRFLGRDRSEAR